MDRIRHNQINTSHTYCAGLCYSWYVFLFGIHKYYVVFGTQQLNQSKGEVKITKRHKTFPPSSKLSSRTFTWWLHLNFFLLPQIVSWDLETWDCHWETFGPVCGWKLLDSSLWQMRHRHMAKLRITGFLLVLTVTSQIASGLPKWTILAGHYQIICSLLILFILKS